MNNYNRFPVAFKKGRGAYLWDTAGKKYIDLVAGVAVNLLGYAHPRLSYVLAKAADQPWHVSNLYTIPEQEELARMLVERSFPSKAFFCNSGLEANEAAVKLARKWGNDTSDQVRNEIITATRSFHGRSLAMIAASGQEKLRKGFSPDFPGFAYVPFGDIEILRAAITPKTCAIMLEPVQGEGGVFVATQAYLKSVKDLCQEHKLLLILDEIQSGLARTGELFAYQHYGIMPDIMTLAKGLGSGIPIGAMLAREGVAESFTPGSHGSTFGGNPLVCKVAQEVLRVIDEEGLVAQTRELGTYFLKRLQEMALHFSFIKDVRGLGLMLAMDVDFPARMVAEKCLAAGLIVNPVQEKTLRFLPPLVIQKKQLDEACDLLEDVFKDLA